MQLEINVIDAFTDTVFRGNSAAVIITDSWLDATLMQSIAFENNLSETAFIVSDDKGVYHIRWFSPLTEIDFCGHATLASAFVLFKKNPTLKTIKFSAKAVGILTIVQMDNGKIQMDFPNRMPEKVSNIPDSLLAGLSITPVEVYQNAQAYFVIYDSESDVLNVLRDNEALKQLAPLDVVVTCQSESDKYDFISRYFWPANGGDEDPVTGSAHTGLAPLWAERLGNSELLAYQASKRGGVLDCMVKSDRVLISGNAVQYLTGFITVKE
ncbi:PhzF family phenazine biosynthesis protein [Psychrobacter sp. DAB_AL62B]|uniref:PhzF family phenazine biosynthesis protein n=1 Tax=Psychrobacter sp. DAB_AL62B TaxID=1028420 RepID=UPI002381740A|nr:PhzF family phenazine biosynthesis protein [Psychrobacter sp. DAB_AL62B]MDE4454149.1 PhzF family phenazine biosynthesis protein [Psychrobacter sp. DAB_AL62B]